MANLIAMASPRTSTTPKASSPHCSPAHYGFGYEVNADYATYGHQETREGEYTQGVYHVDLPDGRKQVVNYHVEGDSGECECEDACHELGDIHISRPPDEKSPVICGQISQINYVDLWEMGLGIYNLKTD